MKNTNTHRFSQLPDGIKLRLFGPILILTAASATLVQGIIFLLAYALGLGLPFLLVGILLDRMSPFMHRIRRYTGPISLIGGILLILSGRLDQLANDFLTAMSALARLA